MITRYRFGPAAEAAFLRSFARGELVVGNLVDEDFERMAQLVEQYDNFPLGGPTRASSPSRSGVRSPRSSPPTVGTSQPSVRDTSMPSSSCRSRAGSRRSGSNRRPPAYGVEARTDERVVGRGLLRLEAIDVNGSCRAPSRWPPLPAGFGRRASATPQRRGGPRFAPRRAAAARSARS